MTVEEQIAEILITRDIDAFVAGDFDRVRDDFDERLFTAYSGAGGIVTLAYPDLDSYRTEWLAQARAFRDVDPAVLAEELRAAQRITRLQVRGGRALATKVFDGEVLASEGRTALHWTTYYFLRADDREDRWLITGFVGYLPTTWSPS